MHIDAHDTPGDSQGSGHEASNSPGSQAGKKLDDHCSELYERQLLEGRQANYEARDQAVLKLASGGLALSLAFIQNVVPLKDAAYLWLLIASWVLFAGSVLCVLFSYRFGIAAHDARLEGLRNPRVEAEQESENNAAEKQEPERLSNRTEGFNTVAVSFLGLAVLTTVGFASINACLVNSPGGTTSQKRSAMVSEQKITDQREPQDQERKAIVPPKPPAPKPSQQPQEPQRTEKLPQK